MKSSRLPSQTPRRGHAMDAIHQTEILLSWADATITGAFYCHILLSRNFRSRMARSKGKERVPAGKIFAIVSENISPFEMVLSGQHHVNNSQRPVAFPPFEILAVSYEGIAAHHHAGPGAACSFRLWKMLLRPGSQ